MSCRQLLRGVGLAVVGNVLGCRRHQSGDCPVRATGPRRRIPPISRLELREVVPEPRAEPRPHPARPESRRSGVLRRNEESDVEIVDATYPDIVRSSDVEAEPSAVTRELTVAPDVHTGDAGFRPDIQGLRAIAVTIVVLFHAGLGFPGGFVGVDVFFVVSGYVITRMLRRHLVVSDTVPMRDFYMRRIRRILPALAITLVLVLLTAPVLGPAASGQITRRTGVTGALFVSNMYLMRAENGYFDVDSNANPLLHIWSLSVEEQFYFVFPLLLLVAWRMSRRWRRPARGSVVLLAAVGLGSFGLSTILLGGRSPLEGDLSQQVAFFSLPTRAWEFLVGVLLALTAAKLRGRAATAAALCGLAMIAAATFVFDAHTTFPGAAALLPVAGTALLLVAGTDPAAPTNRLLSSSPFQRIGDLSYSWYLWHWPLIVFAVALFPASKLAGPAAALIALIPATASYAWVESPIRRQFGMRPTATVGLGLACVALPLGAALLSARIEQSWPPKVQEFVEALGPHSYQERPCDEAEAPSDPETCTWELPDGRPSNGQIVLIGDSNAGQFSEAFLQSSEQMGYSATVQTRSSCAFIDLYFADSKGHVDEACRSFYEDRLGWLVRTQPSLVVLAGVSDSLIQSEGRLASAPTGPWRNDPAEKAAEWTEGLARTMTQLEKAGIPSMVVHPVPRFPGWNDPTLCAPLRIVLDEGGCGATVSETHALEYAELSREAEKRAVEQVPGSSALDLWSELCEKGTCETYRDGMWWYQNWNHLSASGSQALAHPFGAAMEGAIARAS